MMNKIADAFEGKKAFLTYLMAGDPDLKTSGEYILAAQEAGADMVEIGIPFSDPIAEGPVIQAASIRALAAGSRLDGVFALVKEIQPQMHIPMVFMTYLNPVYVYGYHAFFAKCREIGICGVIIPDLPYEEQGEAKTVAQQYGVELVTLAAPTSADRIEKIAAEAEGFLYLVSSMGVTGVRSEITTDISGMVAQVRSVSKIPVAVGFGIATPAQAAQSAADADGVIVGSAIVKLIGEHGINARQPLIEYIQSIKAAVRETEN